MTLPLLILLWGLAAITAVAFLWSLYRRRWGIAAAAYFGFGLFFLALPLKFALWATTIAGVIFMAAIWPIWLLQGPLGYQVMDWAEPSFWWWMFDV